MTIRLYIGPVELPVQGQRMQVPVTPNKVPRREKMFPVSLRTNFMDYISHFTDFLQAPGDSALACPAELETNYAALC